VSAGQSVLVAGATGYLGKFVVRAFKARGYRVRVLARSVQRLQAPGPFTAPALGGDDYDELFVGELGKPETLAGLMDGVDVVFSSVGISRQRDGLTFEQVDHQYNRRLIELAEAAGVQRFVYVSMQGAEQLMHLEITRAHEKVVQRLRESPMSHGIVRPCGYFSDMGALYDMASKGRSFLVGPGDNRMSPIHGADLAEVCVDVAAGTVEDVEAGGPEVLTQREAAVLAFEVLCKAPKITVVPLWLARGIARMIGLLSRQFGDLADFIVIAGEVDGVGPPLGKQTLRSYFEYLRKKDLADAN
jgi:uncharacterized protein YbjT (DUF2867 family)